jgi:hypothetical protein
MVAGIVSSAITFQSVTMSARAGNALLTKASRAIATVADRMMEAETGDLTDIGISCTY